MKRKTPAMTYAIPFFDKSGPMRAPYLICKGFSESGWNVDILTISSPENADIHLAWNEVLVRRIEGSGKKAKLIKLGMELLKKRERHVVLTWVWYWHCFALVISKLLFNSPYALALDTYTYFADWDMKSRLSKLRLSIRYGLVMRNADIILAESPLSFDQAKRHFENVRILQVPVCLWEKDLKDIEEEWLLEGYQPKREPTVLFTGRIVPSKRIHDLVESFISVSQEYGDWKLEIRGLIKDSEYYSHLVELACSSNANDRINFLPSLTGQDLYKRYREVAIYCLPSEFEGMPTAILEAMYFGGAIISGNVGAVSYQLDNGYCGLLYEPGDLDTLQSHLRTLMASEDKRVLYMRRSRERLLQYFTWERYFEEVERNFSELIGSQSGQSTSENYD